MYGVQSAIAIKRERKKRESVKGGTKAPLPVISRAQLKPPVQKANLTYFNVGASFILIGSFLVLTSVIPDDILGMNLESEFCRVCQNVKSTRYAVKSLVLDLS